MALTGDVTVPGGGKVPRKAAAAGLAVVAALVGYYYYKQRKSASAAATAPAATTTDQYPPDGTTGNPSDPYSTDPATGQTYGDESAGTGTYGAYGTGGAGTSSDPYPWDGTTGNPSDPYSQDPATGITYGDEGGGTGGTGGGGGTGGPPFATNSAWSDWVIARLETDSPGVSASALVDALGLYLEGLPVTAAQKTLIEDCRALGGDPPVSGAGGYPPAVKLNGGKGGHGNAHNPVTGLKASAVGKTVATVSWTADPAETTYSAKITTGHTTVRTQTGAGHSTHIGGLKPKTKYDVAVLARPAAAGAKPGTVSFTTA